MKKRDEGRQVAIDHKTIIFTHSTEPDEVIREKYLAKLRLSKSQSGSPFNKPPFGKANEDPTTV